jgi:multimeric flavodoxin WrbA
LKALILNGASDLRDTAGVVEDAFARQLSARGYAVVRHDLASLAIPECKGDFGCWTVTPGVCVQAGPHRDVARDLIQSDLVVWLTPLTFGGYSSALKRQLDHCIPLITPWFTTLEGETHHEPRYERFPDVLAVGFVERKEPEAARVFERLVSRNALNMHTRHFLSPVITRAELADAEAHVGSWLDELRTSSPPHVDGEPLDLSPRQDLPAERPRSALLVVGSPRGSASVSAAIAKHLATLLAERGVLVTTEHIHGRPPRTNLELDDPGGRREADLLALATPLYVDSLPAPVTALFETLARSRCLAASSRPRFLAILNCGFPESVHNDTALAICRQFAGQAKLNWIGGLGIGGGGMFAGKPLAQLGGRAQGLARALALTADAVAQGRVVPDEARRLVGKLPIPSWLYRFFGDWGFRQEAKKHGVRARIGARPYAA